MNPTKHVTSVVLGHNEKTELTIELKEVSDTGLEL